MAASARESAARAAAAPARPHDAGARGQRAAAPRSPGAASGPSRSPSPEGAAPPRLRGRGGGGERTHGRASSPTGGVLSAPRVPWI